eukprot:COSAG02_NODE_5749_length_4068_cov_14.293525_4_plen_187_part_00
MASAAIGVRPPSATVTLENHQRPSASPLLPPHTPCIAGPALCLGDNCLHPSWRTRALHEQLALLALLYSTAFKPRPRAAPRAARGPRAACMVPRHAAGARTRGIAGHRDGRTPQTPKPTSGHLINDHCAKLWDKEIVLVGRFPSQILPYTYRLARVPELGAPRGHLNETVDLACMQPLCPRWAVKS